MPPLYGQSFRFRPGIIPTLAAVAGVALFVSLGRWQLARMHEKEDLFARFARGDTPSQPLWQVLSGPGGSAETSEKTRYVRVSVAGRYDSGHQFLLDNMTHDGRVGYRVLTPLVTDEGTQVLVDRGWIPAGADRSQLPAVDVDASPRQVTGRLDELPGAGIALENKDGAGWPRVLSYPRMEELSRALQQPLPGQIVLLDAAEPDGFVRAWRPAAFPPERHWGYAVTWFTLAAAVGVVFIVTNLTRKPREPLKP